MLKKRTPCYIAAYLLGSSVTNAIRLQDNYGKEFNANSKIQTEQITQDFVDKSTLA